MNKTDDDEELLRTARRTGHLEYAFAEEEFAEPGGLAQRPNRLQAAWEAQCALDGRLPVSIGRVRDGYFVAVPRIRESMCRTALELWHLYFDDEPTVDGEAWYSPLVPREIAVSAARALAVADVEDQRRGRWT